MKEAYSRNGANPMDRFDEGDVNGDVLALEVERGGEEVIRRAFRFRPGKGGRTQNGEAGNEEELCFHTGMKTRRREKVSRHKR